MNKKKFIKLIQVVAEFIMVLGFIAMVYQSLTSSSTNYTLYYILLIGSGSLFLATSVIIYSDQKKDYLEDRAKYFSISNLDCDYIIDYLKDKNISLRSFLTTPKKYVFKATGRKYSDDTIKEIIVYVRNRY